MMDHKDIPGWVDPPLPVNWDAYSHADMCEYISAMHAIYAHQLTDEIKAWVLAAYLSTDYNWRKSNGCNVVDEGPFEGKFRHPMCVAHDFCCWKAARGLYSRRKGDKMFRKGNLGMGMSKIEALRRYIGVRGGAYLALIRGLLPRAGW